MPVTSTGGKVTLSDWRPGEQRGVQYLAQGHFKISNPDLPTGSQPCYLLSYSRPTIHYVERVDHLLSHPEESLGLCYDSKQQQVEAALNAPVDRNKGK